MVLNNIGIFSLDSEFILTTIVEYNTLVPRTLVAGFDIEVPFNITMSADDRTRFLHPKIVAIGTKNITMTPHQMKIKPSSSASLNAAVYNSNPKAEIVPVFNINFSLLKAEIDFKVTLGHKMTVSAITGIKAQCPVEKIKVFLFLNI
jgi:hypothetical protein